MRTTRHQQDPFDDLRAELERAADRLAPQPTAPPRWRRRPVLALGAIAVVAGVVALTTALDDGQIDPLEATAAAIATNGDTILHIVAEGGPTNPNGEPTRSGLSVDGRRVEGFFGRRFEQWSTARPLRFRSTQGLTRPDGTALGTYDSGVTDAGQSWTDRSWDDQLPRIERLQDAAPAGDADAVGAFGSTDPIAALRAGLADGTVRDTGTEDIDGTPSLRLERATGKRRTVYLVDEDDHQPFLIRRYENGRLSEVLRITTFERRPSENRELNIFTIPTTGSKK